MPIKDRKPTLQAVGWVRDMYRAKLLDLDPPYQRRSVWNRSFQQFFIDTVLRNYPSPPIFVNMEVTEAGASLYHVIDGKQRLLAILNFLEDKFPISNEKYSLPTLAGKYFSQLDLETQKKIYGYFLPFEFFTEVDEEVTEIFDRFNRNVQRLNEQELRHARFGGAFITLMEQLASEPFWRELKIFGLADIRRMKDVEFTSIIFVLTVFGIQDGDSGLDQIYADWDEAVPELEERLAKWRATQEIVQHFSAVVSGTRFKNKGDFYSLWSVLADFAAQPEVIDYERTSENLRNFAANVDRVPELEDPRVAGEDALAYSQAVRAGTTKGENRTKRKEILIRCIQRR
jgi:hypothetical protein